jgi:hypothetical protein
VDVEVNVTEAGFRAKHVNPVETESVRLTVPVKPYFCPIVMVQLADVAGKVFNGFGAAEIAKSATLREIEIAWLTPPDGSVAPIDRVYVPGGVELVVWIVIVDNPELVAVREIPIGFGVTVMPFAGGGGVRDTVV